MAKNKYYSGQFNKQNGNQTFAATQSETQVENQEEQQMDNSEEEQQDVVETSDAQEAEKVIPAAPQVVEEELKKSDETKKTTTTVSSDKKGFKPVYKIELELTSYMEEMNPKKPIDPEVGGKWQYSLYTILRNIFNTDSQEQFNAEFNTVLGFFHKNKKSDNALSENFIYRPYMWTGSEKEYVVFRKLIQLIIETADHKARKSFASKIDFSKTFGELKEQERQLLINFYG